MDRIESLLKLLEKGPESALLRFSLGGACIKAGRLNEAVAHLSRAVELEPRYSAAWKLLGQAYAQAGNADAAINAYEQGIAAAEARGDIQARKEMSVFLKRLRQQPP